VRLAAGAPQPAQKGPVSGAPQAAQTGGGATG
jgi:hypothetical protein